MYPKRGPYMSGTTSGVFVGPGAAAGLLKSQLSKSTSPERMSHATVPALSEISWIDCVMNAGSNGEQKSEIVFDGGKAG